MPDLNEQPNDLNLEVIPVEDLEGEEVADPLAEPEGDAKAESESEQEGSKPPESIPYSRFQEVTSDARQAKEAAQMLYQQNQQLMQALMNMQQQRQAQAPQQKVDPEAEAFVKLLKPALEAENRPLLEHLARQEQVIQSLTSQQNSQAAWNWLQNSVPDLNDLAPDLLAYIESRPDKGEILADPNRVYDMAQIVRLTRQAGGKKQEASVVHQARQESRARGRAELPNTQTRTSTKDWSKVPDADFAEAMRQAGF